VGRNEDGTDSSEGEYETRGPREQAPTVGLLPPSDSDSDEYDESENEEKLQVGNVTLPPPKNNDKGEGEDDDDEEDDEDEDDEDEDEDASVPNGRRVVNGGDVESSGRRGKKEQIAEEQVRVDLERLELVKKRREEQREKRIAEEGWDRFAPVSETNKPPLPGDHPSMRGA
jgi:hypothetical protein